MHGTRSTAQLSRRHLLGGLAGASALTLLSGCTELIEGIANSCPSDPAESGGVTWIPDVAHPVFWGFQDLTAAANGTPRDMQIFYPTHHGFTAAPPILKLCLTRWPVVLFLHGQPPLGLPFNGWHRKFWQLPATLARCGYVVVVPNHAAQLPIGDFAPAVAEAMQDINWVRTQWADSNWVDKQPTSTAVVGHSFGALLATRVAAAHPEIGALVSLGGPYLDLDDPLPSLQAVSAPSFLMWAKEGIGSRLIFEDLDGAGKIWDKLTQPKYAAVYKGEHFDYLRPEDVGNAERGPCSLIGGVAGDLAALFISANVKVSLSRTQVPVDLKKPQVPLSFEQEFFAGSHLITQEQMNGRADCRLDLRWKVNNATGSRRIGP